MHNNDSELQQIAENLRAHLKGYWEAAGSPPHSAEVILWDHDRSPLTRTLEDLTRETAEALYEWIAANPSHPSGEALCTLQHYREWAQKKHA